MAFLFGSAFLNSTSSAKITTGNTCAAFARQLTEVLYLAVATGKKSHRDRSFYRAAGETRLAPKVAAVFATLDLTDAGKSDLSLVIGRLN